MNPSRSLAALSFAVAAQAQAPKVEMALFTDEAHNVVYRLDLPTGRYFGTIGAGHLYYPQAVAVDAKGTAYVVDVTGVKKFDVSTGRYLGMIFVAGNGTYAHDAVIEKDGSLDIIMGGLDSYVVCRLNPTTGAVLGQTAPRPWTLPNFCALTLSPSGAPEAWVTTGTMRVDRFTNNLQLDSFSLLAGPAAKPVHARSGDTLFSLGEYLYGGTELGFESLVRPTGAEVSAAAEGANGAVYEVYASGQGDGMYWIDLFDTAHGKPLFIGLTEVKLPTGAVVGDMAVYVRY